MTAAKRIPYSDEAGSFVYDSHTMPNMDAWPIPGFREPFSCMTHLVAAPVFAVLGCFLVRRGRGSWVRTASLAIMAVSTVFLLSSPFHRSR